MSLGPAALALMVVVAPGVPSKPTIEVPAITQEWLQKAADCEAKAPRPPTDPEAIGEMIAKADAAEKAFTDEVAVSCGFTSREQHDRFRVRLGAAVSEVLAPAAAAQVSAIDSKVTARLIARLKKDQRDGKISASKCAAMEAVYRQGERSAKVYKAWAARKPNQKRLDVSLLMLGLRNISHPATSQLLVEEGKLTAEQRKRFLDELEAGAKRTEAWAREQPALTPDEITAAAKWTQGHGLP